MQVNKGFQNEIEIAKYINNKKIKSLNYIYIDMLQKLYENIDLDDIVYCKVDRNLKKYDIVISIHGVKKYISIKMGAKNSFHAESIFTFKTFLRECNISEENIKNYFHFQYAEQRLYGKIIKLSTVEYKEKYQYRIDSVNQELMQTKLFDEFIYRFIFQGRDKANKIIDGIILGDTTFFHFFTRDELLEILKFHRNKKSTGVHISCLFISPFARCLNNNQKFLDGRHKIQIKWYNLFDDYMLMKMYESKDLVN